jgi:amidase
VSVDDVAGAFCPHGRFEIAGAGAGPLAGLRVAVKDLIDIAGHVTGAGNPRWLATHAPATRTAPCVGALLAAGATMVGKTITDELAYSLNGDNIHYGTPRNSAAPGHVPGGSSSGSAAAVAVGSCDVALGTDSGGSVRIPASYCGLYGIRTSHGAISLDGIVPLQPSFDTVGWFARSADLFARVGAVLLPASPPRPALRRVLIARDVASVIDPGVADALAPAIAATQRLFAVTDMVDVAPGADLEPWRQIARCASAAEAWAIHGAWIDSAAPRFAPPIAERFAWAKTVSAADAAQAEAQRRVIHARVHELVGADGVICLPTAPGPAPRLDATGDAVESFRQRTQRLTCIAGLTGLPQVSIPVARLNGLPIGLSLIGPAGSDAQLLAVCRQLAPADTA